MGPRIKVKVKERKVYVKNKKCKIFWDLGFYEFRVYGFAFRG